MSTPRLRALAVALPLAFFSSLSQAAEPAPALSVTPQGTIETNSVAWLVFNNAYDGLFSDAKMSGIELLQREVRIATNGDVRLQPTPGQWDAAPQIVERRVDPEGRFVEAVLKYPDFNFTYVVRAEPAGTTLRLSVVLDQAIPEALVGRAGFNLEFLPSAYFRKNFAMDEVFSLIPLHPTSEMSKSSEGRFDPLPLAKGKKLVLAPEDPERRVAVTSETGELAFFDGRDQAQNGWFVARSLLPAGKTGTVLSWTVEASTDAAWIRQPNITQSQVGYHPAGKKVALIELDRRSPRDGSARLVRIQADGSTRDVHTAKVEDRGDYLRYRYVAYDFSGVKEAGLYRIEFMDTKGPVFRIAENVYDQAWQPTLDVFLPVQMDHIAVREAYRVWHADAHFDDARQAPVNHVHFDLYAQGPTTDTDFQPGEHVPGLNVGGWLDAGDFDLRTQTQYNLIQNLVHFWEDFRVDRDQTKVDYANRQVTLHEPDGQPDVLQQIEHGVLALLAQHRVFGRAVPGIVEPDLQQYTHLGDAASKTDGKVFDASIDPSVFTEMKSGRPDDRWVFTSRTTPLNYGSAAALAAASRVLTGHRPELAKECLDTAIRVWDEEHSHEPFLFKSGNTTGGDLHDEEFGAAAELFLATKEQKYAQRMSELWTTLGKRFPFGGSLALRVAPQMDESFRAELRNAAVALTQRGVGRFGNNPFNVPITEMGWAGSGMVIRNALTQYQLHRLFPDLFDGQAVFDGLEFIHGRHPGHNLSLVSAVGTHSKEVAYGSNRADFSYIAGGIVPGVLILKPGFPENKEDWPFLWGENEYVVNLGGSYLYLVHAAKDLLKDKR